MIDYVFYSTSKTEYQNWQRDLLEYTFIKVNQSGKLIAYCSENEHNAIPKTIHHTIIENEVDCPDYMNHFHKDKKYGIANKFFSIKLWLENNPELTGTVLFLDPDMIFNDKIDIVVKKGTIIGQLWTDSNIENHKNFKKYTPDSLKHLLIPQNIFMFPFCINIEDLRTIINDYVELSSTIYLNEGSWESEMYALVIAALKHNLKIEGANFGCCNNWHNFNNQDFKMVHYPGKIFDKDKNQIFFKQDFTKNTYTIPWKLFITPYQTTNKVEYQLINALQEYVNLQQIKEKYPDMLYWNNNKIKNNYTPTNKYIFCKPWKGGFNNIRMSFEIAACIAYRLNRILVIPDPYKMYLLDNINGFNDFFEKIDYGIKIITLSEFSRNSNISNNWKEIEKISHVYDFAPDKYYINLSDKKSNMDHHKNFTEIKINNNSKYIYFKENLLGSFYLVIHDNNMLELKRHIYKHIHYKESIFTQAYNIIKYLNSNHGNYYSMHVRRNDFQYKNLFIDDKSLLNNIKNIIPQGSCLYISTDIKNKDELGILNQYYKVFILNDVVNLLDKYINKDLYGMIEQLICTRGQTFIGNDNSTFSTYIYRLRGYMDDIYDKSYIINTSSHVNHNNSLESNWSGNHNIWSREFDTVFNLDSYNNNTIFVSIASYRDSELERTIEDLFKKAKYPENISIGVCIQDTDEQIKSFSYNNHKQVRVESMHYSQAKGVCFARNLIQTKLLKNEKYYLQIDSHSRFNFNWDINLIEQLNSCPHNYPILSCYPNGYKLTDNNNEYLQNKKLSPHAYIKFLDNGSLRTKSSGIFKNSLVISNWIAAGFIFTLSKWCNDVGYPSEIVFNGEEDYLFIKSFIKNYEIFCPPTSNVFHCYVNNLKESSEKYRNLLHDDVNTGKLNNTNDELKLLIESIPHDKYELFKKKYQVCYKTRTILNKNYEIIKEKNTFDNFKIYNDKLNIYLWGISNNKKFILENSGKSILSGNNFGLKVQLLGINYDTSHLDQLKWSKVLARFYLIRTVTSKTTKNKIMIFMDGFDTLFNGDEEQILNEFYKYKTQILISAEKNFTYQWPNYKDKFEKIDSLYKYIAAGTIIGYSNSLNKMANDCINILEKSSGYDRGNDQGILGRYVYENIENTDFIKLDYNCKLFWVTTGDNNVLKKHKLYNPITKTKPLIFHIVGGNRENKKLYNSIFDEIVN